MLHAALQE